MDQLLRMRSILGNVGIFVRAIDSRFGFLLMHEVYTYYAFVFLFLFFFKFEHHVMRGEAHRHLLK